MSEAITRFRGEYEFLSNFYESPVTFGGLTYGSTEAAFQAQKCTTDEERKAFTEYRPMDSKKAGRNVKLRPDWDAVKVGLMEGIIRAKFTQNAGLAARLIATGERELVEGNNWHDLFWGADGKTGEGENHLGRILMKIRDELVRSQS